ncbi:MAG TPA: hypothetical protein VF173_01355 [Thermoanaerobaculia bacterium]|nr:hypothetical protein [Thermoanaerobaculia bacterium]
MATMGEIIQRFSQNFPNLNLLETQCIAQEVPGVYRARQELRGRLNPSTAAIDSGATPQARSAIMVSRYGNGFGLPWKLDTSVLPAISRIPTEDSANFGFHEEENLEPPTEDAKRKLGFSGPLSYTDDQDLRACVNFTELVVKPFNRGLEPGQPVGPAQSPPVSSSLPPATTTPPPAPDQLSLVNGRFVATVTFMDPRTQTTAHAAATKVAETWGYFTFFDRNNPEVVLTLVDGSSAGHWWVKLGGLTNVAFDLLVADHNTGATWTYHNKSGEMLGLIDSAALPA